MKSKTLFLILIFCSFGWKIGFAQQTGDPDTTFRISRNGALVGTIYQVLVQPDQKVLALGNFTGIGNYQSPYLLRFHTDGGVDTTFRSPFFVGQLSFSSDINLGPANNEAQILDGGKILISGQFDSVGAFPIRGISILNLDGLVDSSFQAYKNEFGGGFSFYKQLSAFQNDSGVVYTSALLLNQGNLKNVFTRLKMNGKWDFSFPSIITESPPYSSYLIWKISPLKNHRILVHAKKHCVPCTVHEEEFNYFGFICGGYGQILDSSQYLQINWSTINFQWAKEDSSNILYSYIYHMYDWGGEGLVRVNTDIDSVTKFGIQHNLSDAEMMDGIELIGVQQFFSGAADIVKVVNVSSIPSSFGIGATNGIVNSITRNAYNQAYLAGDFTQYNGQDFPKLVRIHNFKTITGVSSKVEESKFSLSPNPSSAGSCVLKTSTKSVPYISVTYQLGRNVAHSVSRISDDSFALKLVNSSIAAGIYVVKVADGHRVKTVKWWVAGE